MTKTNSEEFAIQPVQNSSLFVTETPEGNVFDFYLMGEIGDPSEFAEVCHALRVAEPNDIFVIHLNSVGGQCRSGYMLVNAIEEAQCYTVGYIEHHCFSMAGPIFLACDSWQVSDKAEFMAHTTSAGIFGKESDTYEATIFSRKQTHKQIRETYKHFLTQEEIERVIGGNDVYLDAEEIEQRLEGYAEHRAELAKEAEGDSSCGPQDLTDVVSEAVEKILVKYGVIDDAQEETIELPEGVEDKLKEDSESAVKLPEKLQNKRVDDFITYSSSLDAQIEKAAQELEALLDEQQCNQLNDSFLHTHQEDISGDDLYLRRERAMRNIKDVLKEEQE